MDNKQFLDYLSQVAELESRTPKTTPNIRLDETDTNDVRWGNEFITINKEQNPTLGVEIIKYRTKEKECVLGCGQMVKDQMLEHRVCFSPIKHWRTRCANCECFLTPDGQFIKGGHAIQSFYVKFFKAHDK